MVASTLTVLAVFLPLTMISGLMGLFFSQLGFIVAITVSVSTIAALSLTPMLVSKLMKPGGGRSSGFGPRVTNAIVGALEAIDNTYERILTYAVRRRVFIVILSVLIFFGSFALMPFIGTASCRSRIRTGSMPISNSP